MGRGGGGGGGGYLVSQSPLGHIFLTKIPAISTPLPPQLLVFRHLRSSLSYKRLGAQTAYSARGGFHVRLLYLTKDSLGKNGISLLTIILDKLGKYGQQERQNITNNRNAIKHGRVKHKRSYIYASILTHSHTESLRSHVQASAKIS